MNGTKEEMHIYLVAWPTKKFNPERSTATTRKRGDAEEQWPRRRSCNVLILRLSWLCTRSGIPSRKRREVAGLSLSLSLLVLSSPPVGKARWRKQSTRYTHDVTDTCSRAASRDRFRRVDMASLVFPNLCIFRMKGYFYPKLIISENFQDLSSFLVIVESRLIQNYFMADYSIILNIKYICKCRFFNNNDLYFYE